jgi:hypothetical protein
MPDFDELLMEAHRVLEKAQIVTDDVKRTGVHFVTTELDLGTTFAESALLHFSAGHLDKAKRVGCKGRVSGCPKVLT